MALGNPGQMVRVIRAVGRSTGYEKEVNIVSDFSVWKLFLPEGEAASPLFPLIDTGVVLSNYAE